MATGELHDVPAENVTTHASPSLRNRALAAALRSTADVEHRAPGQFLRPVTAFLSRHLQREQRPREPLTPEQRAELIPEFAADIAILESLTGESYADWLDPRRPGHTRAPKPAGRIGTAYGSIDRPFSEPDVP